ncbi:MAG TPA: helix-turn-helix transcriptional regulator [Pyrinomonadaceae bacterium]|jgi:transcriptional regulator with XRE-family HTH domain
MNNATHWTERSAEDFLYSIASDFVEQLQSKMATLNNMTRAKLAKAAGISKGRISQIFNDPGNISLDTAIRLARALGLSVSLLTYENTADPNNERGPVNADVFRICWEKAGRPFDMWDIQRLSQAAPRLADCYVQIPKGRHGTMRPGQSIAGIENLPWEVLSIAHTKSVSLNQFVPKKDVAS